MPGERLVETVDQFRRDNERFERGQRQITNGINEIQNGAWNDGAQHVLQGIRNEAWYGAKTFLNIDIDNANVRAILAGTLPTLIIDQGGRENPNGR